MLRRRSLVRAIRPALLALTATLGLSLAPASAAHDVAQSEARPALGIMGTIPIYWGESGGNFDALLAGEGEAHWAKAQLERNYRLEPIDYLSSEAIESHRFLLLAQPRGLSPEENVALDGWVRKGGRLLLFADPMMTGHSHYGLGDRRRPQDVTLLSPILAHWGLQLRFDDAQTEGVYGREIRGHAIPVNLPGQFALLEGKEDCITLGDSLAAHCRLGEGQALILADAALLDEEGPWKNAASGLDRLLGEIFGEMQGGEGTGASATAGIAQKPQNSAKNVSDGYSIE